MIIKNYPFKDVRSEDLTKEIKEACPNAAMSDIIAYVEGSDMRPFNAASIYYFAVRKFG